MYPQIMTVLEYLGIAWISLMVGGFVLAALFSFQSSIWKSGESGRTKYRTFLLAPIASGLVSFLVLSQMMSTKPPETSKIVDPFFGTCREAKANGYGPYYQGIDGEYSWYIDRDSDGVVCE